MGKKCKEDLWEKLLNLAHLYCNERWRCHSEEGPNPERPKVHPDDGRDDIYEPVGQERSDPEEDDVTEEAVPVVLNLLGPLG